MDSISPPAVVVICQLTVDERRVLALRRAQGSRQRRAWRRRHLGWLAWMLAGAVVLVLTLHSHRSGPGRTAVGVATCIGSAGVACAWVLTSRQRSARLQRWPDMTITISRHGLTVQDARTANRLEWADIGPICSHRHGLEFHDRYGNLLAYLPIRLLNDGQRRQVASLVQAAGRMMTPVPD